MQIALFATTFRDREASLTALRFITGAQEAGVGVVIAPTTAHSFTEWNIDSGSLKNCRISDAGRLPEDIDFVISLGGDGTFLRAARWSGDSDVPVVGVNMGHLGYLSPFSPSQLDSLLNILSTGAYDIEERALLHVELPDDIARQQEHFWPYALNEVAFLKQDTASMIELPVKLDGKYLAVYRADGLIVATPTGSTGYSLSVGGPILQPTVEAFVLSPIADHSLTMRPMVIDNGMTIEVTATGRISSFRLSLDGHSLTLPAETPVKIEKAPFRCKVVGLPDDLFASALRRKLLWGNH